MKTKLLLLALLAALAGEAKASADTVVLLDAPKAADFNFDLNVEGRRNFSIQIDYADASPATVSFVDGNYSSMTLTVANYELLRGRASSATFTIVDGQNESLSGVSLTINGQTYAAGTHWAVGYTSTATAANIAAVMDAYFEYAATASSNVVTVTANSTGTAANSWTVTTSNASKIAKSNFTTGRAYGTIRIGDTTLTEATDFDAITSSHVTANSIARAINANSTLSALISVSSATEPLAVNTTQAGILNLNAKVTAATEYPVSIDPASAITSGKNKITGGSASDVSVADNTIAETSHGLPTGLAVYLTTTTNVAVPTGLGWGATYYIIPVNANSFKLSSSLSGAVAGTAIDITANTGGAAMTLTPIAFVSSSTDGFKFQGSNNGTSFYDLSVATVPYHADSGALQSFTDYAYKWLRIVFSGPSRGAIDIDYTLSGDR